MSRQHPVIAVTGSSGAGTSFVKQTFENIFRREGVYAAFIEGDSFHSLTRANFRKKSQEIADFSHFGPEANDFHSLEKLFRTYSENGSGQKRYYLHNHEEAVFHQQRLAKSGISCTSGSGEFTPWEDIEQGTDILFYEGLHGMVRDDTENKEYGGYDVASHVDLGIGVVPSVNLEWIQKIKRDNAERGYDLKDTVDNILQRMPDYINHITPQFSNTHINFQRVPTVDTSNPFIARDIPTPDESFVVIRFADPQRFDTDFPYLLSMIRNSFMSRRNSIVVPGGKMILAMELILSPIIHKMIEEKNDVSFTMTKTLPRK